MRYLVAVKAQAYITRTVLVEASTESEAGKSARVLVSRADRLVPDTFEVVSVKESPSATVRNGYLKGII